MFPYFETLACLDGQLLNLAAHQARCAATIHQLVPLGKVPDWLIEPHVPVEYQQGLYRVKLQYTGFEAKVEWYLYERQRPTQLFFHEVGPWEYAFKRTDRSYFATWTHVYGGEIWCHRGGELLDTSYTHVAIWFQDRWVTPQTWLLPSTKRQWLVGQGDLDEVPLTIATLPDEGYLILYNAMRDWEDIFKFKKGTDRVFLQVETNEKVVKNLRRFPKIM